MAIGAVFTFLSSVKVLHPLLRRQTTHELCLAWSWGAMYEHLRVVPPGKRLRVPSCTRPPYSVSLQEIWVRIFKGKSASYEQASSRTSWLKAFFCNPCKPKARPQNFSTFMQSLQSLQSKPFSQNVQLLGCVCKTCKNCDNCFCSTRLVAPTKKLGEGK